MAYPKIFDAANPPSTAPGGMAGVMGYVGGPGATHVWTPAEWQPFAHLAQFPVWVADLGADPAAQASQATAAARGLGWAAFMPEPGRRAIIADLEASADPAWYERWAAEVTADGFIPVAYGSLSTVLGNAAEAVLAADWDVIPVIPAGQTLHGLQYEADVAMLGTLLDFSVFDAWLFARGGQGARHL
jgi:hypothetical protein